LIATKISPMNSSKFISTLKKLCSINSPSGYTIEINDYLKGVFDEFSINYTESNKGSILVPFSDAPELVVTAHVDTLGAMVKEIREDGWLGISLIGGYSFNSIEGEYVTVRNSNGKLFRGTFLLNNPALHVNKDFSSQKRDAANMGIRLDEEVFNDTEVDKLGIEVGDYVFFDHRFEVTDNGFIKSRYLDDKACAAIMIELILENKNELKDKPIAFYFSNYEEVGHGSTMGIPRSAKELLVLDMAVVGYGCKGSETKVSICAKDSSGPYDYSMTTSLKHLAKQNNLDFVIDIYPFYGSDGSAALLSGYDIKVALIGPGVSASHGLERTHIKGLENTTKLAQAYLMNFLNHNK